MKKIVMVLATVSTLCATEHTTISSERGDQNDPGKPLSQDVVNTPIIGNTPEKPLEKIAKKHNPKADFLRSFEEQFNNNIAVIAARESASLLFCNADGDIDWNRIYLAGAFAAGIFVGRRFSLRTRPVEELIKKNHERLMQQLSKKQE